jgi:arginyl-tRNA--protein-N-Asp/Glu arginylyltransferase
MLWGFERPNRYRDHHSRDTPQFYLTAPSPCPYLPGKGERKVFTHLVGERAGDLNDLLTHGGFRRSQSIAYRPACEACRACISVRVVRTNSVRRAACGASATNMPTDRRECACRCRPRSKYSVFAPICDHAISMAAWRT